MERTVSVAAFLNTPVCSCWSEPPSSDLFAALPIFGRTQSPTSMVASSSWIANVDTTVRMSRSRC